MFRTYTPIFRSNECYNSFTYAAYRVLGVVRCRSWGVCVLVACCSATVEFRGWGFEHPNPPLGTPLVQPSLSTLSSDAQSLFLPQPDTCAPHNTTQHNTTQHILVSSSLMMSFKGYPETSHLSYNTTSRRNPKKVTSTQDVSTFPKAIKRKLSTSGFNLPFICSHSRTNEIFHFPAIIWKVQIFRDGTFHNDFHLDSQTYRNSCMHVHCPAHCAFLQQHDTLQCCKMQAAVCEGSPANSSQI